MSAKLEMLSNALRSVLGESIGRLVSVSGELTLEVGAQDYSRVARLLRDDAGLRFEQLIDLCGVDYSTHSVIADGRRRYAVVSHLLSIRNNWRLRLRAFCAEDDFPAIDSLLEVWPSANWFEREAFDLFGIMFLGHTDLRRILTDYGFVGHPFRKDFPISGYVEMRYDPDQQRVVYQPVTIEPRENTPRIVREENYGNVGNG